MFELPYQIAFDRPWFLLLLVAVPITWWLGFVSLPGVRSRRGVLANVVVALALFAGVAVGVNFTRYEAGVLGWWVSLLAAGAIVLGLGVAFLRVGGMEMRWALAMNLRALIVTLLVLAAAEVQWVRMNDGLTVLYLLDQSRSIPAERRREMIDYVNKAVEKHRHDKDRAGVIVFGREGVIELPPFDDYLQLTTDAQSQVDPDFTNLAGAIKLAQATFSEDQGRRVVIVTDGAQNIGDALEQARRAADSGVSIDVRPVEFAPSREALVEKVSIPSEIRKGEPFFLRVVVNNITPPDAEDSAGISGRIIVQERTGDRVEPIHEQAVVLPPGKKVYEVGPIKVDRPEFYTFEARFVPDNVADDDMPENNSASAFTHVRGRGEALLLENGDTPGEFDILAERLAQDNLEVTRRSVAEFSFSGLADLQRFDTVILANVPREQFSDRQIDILAQNTEQLGSGLVMLGGPNSFGAGGWNNTPIEKAMPVDFQIKNAKVTPKGALALIMHASELPEGNYWQKVIAKEAIKALGYEDYAGLLHFTGSRDDWLWRNGGAGIIKVGGMRERMLGLIDRMIPGDMPDFNPGLQKSITAFQGLSQVGAKHIIVISDGDPVPPSASVLRTLKDMKVTVSSVAVGCHGFTEFATMKDIANKTGGKYYEVKDPRALPRIFQREARRVAQPLVFETETPFSPSLAMRNELTAGLEGPLPPLTGYVRTSVKANKLVEVEILSPQPAGDENVILASWPYGVGKTVAFTTDVGARWAKNWPGWENYAKLFTQVVRWSMRPVGDQGKFTVSREVVDGKVRLFVDAFDNEDEFLNFLEIGGVLIRPDLTSTPVRLRQTAPGRYSAEFAGEDPGNYLISLQTGAETAPLRIGVNIPYSAEFRRRETDLTLLESLASMSPDDAPPGLFIRDVSGQSDPTELLRFDSFRHDLPKARSTREAWHFPLLAAGCLFFADVFLRRVTVHLDWLPPLSSRVWRRVRGQEEPPPRTEMMERLRGRKAAVDEALEQRRAATRFEPIPDAPVDVLKTLDDPLSSYPTAAPPSSPAENLVVGPKDEETYTERLLKAKKKARSEFDKGDGK